MSKNGKEEFWRKFLIVANRKTVLYKNSKILRGKHFLRINTEVSGVYFSTVSALKKSWLTLCIQRGADSENIFLDIQRHQCPIERKFKESLVWENKPDAQRCKIMTHPIPRGRTTDDVDALSELLVEEMDRFFYAIRPFLSSECVKKRVSKPAVDVRVDSISKDGFSALNCLFMEVMGCRTCFENSIVRHANVDLPQPRFVGGKYFSSASKVLVLALNPGAGKTSKKVELNRAWKQCLHDYENGKRTIDDLFSFQKEQMSSWGSPSGSYLKFYCDGMGLCLDEIALANIAWCADANNEYPKKMLDDCFQRHAGILVKILAPKIVILSGSDTHRFKKRILGILPTSSVIKTLHYAHREGAERECRELAVVRKEIEAISDRVIIGEVNYE